jgi:hypothetical protein
MMNTGKRTQASDARLAKALYLWYTEERPKRPDPYDGYPEGGGFFGPCYEWVDNKDGTSSQKPIDTKECKKLRKECHKWAKKADRIEKKYHDEDTKKAYQLLTIRDGLWT